MNHVDNESFIMIHLIITLHIVVCTKGDLPGEKIINPKLLIKRPSSLYNGESPSSFVSTQQIGNKEGL